MRPPEPSPGPLLVVERLSKRYPRRRADPVDAVREVSFRVAAGEVVGLLGPNGAGKTTTLKMICGLVTPDAGRVLVGGHDVRQERARALRRLSAVLEGNRNLYWRLTARENLEYFAGNRGWSRRRVRPEIDRLLERFGLVDKRDALVNTLSRGMQQKLALAVALLAGADLLLLDEPTLGLDVEAGHEVRGLLREIASEGRTVVLSTHDMALVQDLCERAVIVGAGRVVTDDRVDRLLALFETRAYAVELGRALSAAQEARLRRAFPAVAVEGLGLRVTLEHGEDFYRLVDVLRLEETPIESVGRTPVHFERVFRRLLREAGEAGRG